MYNVNEVQNTQLSFKRQSCKINDVGLNYAGRAGEK